MTLVDGLRLAVGTLTVAPVTPPSRVDARVGRLAMLAAPAVGLALALVAVAVVAAGRAVDVPAAVCATLVVAVLALATRGLHLDGLADTADGLAASYDRERALAVMRTGDVGPAGVATVVLVLLVQVSAIAATVDDEKAATAVLVAVVAGRAVLPLVCSRVVPAARSDGLGATVAGTVGLPAAALVAAVVVAAAAVVGGSQAAIAVGVGWGVAAVLVVRCVRRLGGVTGDVLGAAVELATAGALVVLSV